MNIRDIHGGDLVELNNGAVVKVYDIHNEHIVVSCVERYHVSEIKRILERFKA